MLAPVTNLSYLAAAKAAPISSDISSSLKEIFDTSAYKKTLDGSAPALELKDRVSTLAKERHAAAKKTLDIPLLNGKKIEELLTGAELIKTPKIKELISICKEIITLLQKDSLNHEQIQTVREKINQALHLKGYVLSDSPNSDCQSICRTFLQHLSYQINTHAKGMDVFEEIGEEALKNYTKEHISRSNEEKVSSKEIAAWTKEVFSNAPGHNWESSWNWLRWALTHLIQTFLSFIDNHISGGHHFYNSYALGNANTWIGEVIVENKPIEKKDEPIHPIGDGILRIDLNRSIPDKEEVVQISKPISAATEKKILFNLGPSPVADDLIQAQIELQKKSGSNHLVHDLQDPKKKGEGARIQKTRELSKEMRLETSLNHPLGKGHLPIQNVADFHEKLKTMNAFEAPLLSSEEKDQVLKASQEIFKSLVPSDLTNITEKERKRLCKAMFLGFTTLLAIKTVIKFASKLDNPELAASMGQACKQDIDRGTIVNTAMLAFIKMIENGHLTGLEAKQMLGIQLMRGLMVDERLMARERLDGFIGLFELISQNEEGFVEKLKAFIGEEKIRFKPSSQS